MWDVCRPRGPLLTHDQRSYATVPDPSYIYAVMAHVWCMPRWTVCRSVDSTGTASLGIGRGWVTPITPPAPHHCALRVRTGTGCMSTGSVRSTDCHRRGSRAACEPTAAVAIPRFGHAPRGRGMGWRASCGSGVGRAPARLPWGLAAPCSRRRACVWVLQGLPWCSPVL